MSIAPCEVIQEVRIWIPDPTAWIPDPTPWIPDSTSWIPDSETIVDSGFQFQGRS